jgi:hypothetical protein
LTSPTRASKALEAAVLALGADQDTAETAAPRWLKTALGLHQNAAGLDDIAAALREAGYAREAIELALAAARSDMRRLGLFLSRAHFR